MVQNSSNKDRWEVENETKFVLITKEGRGPPLIHPWIFEGGAPAYSPLDFRRGGPRLFIPEISKGGPPLIRLARKRGGPRLKI